MKNIDIVLIILLLVILYNIMKKSKPTKEKFHQDVRGRLKTRANLEYLDDLLRVTHDDDYQKKKMNPEYLEVQFHNDYRDAITAFNNIAPSQKQIFNQGNLPVNFTNPSTKEKVIVSIMNDFIREVNNNIVSEVTDSRNGNSGWDEAIPDPKVESGWDKHMKQLGLPASIYPEPAKRGKVELLKIDHAEKYETEDEIKYVIYFIITKKTTEDQLIARISVIYDKRDISEERQFFNRDPEQNMGSLIIEDIFIIGVLVQQGIGRVNQLRDNFYNFKSLENNGMIDQEKLIKELMNKFNQRMSEVNHFNSILDDEAREHRLGVPHLSNYNAYQNTQTIIDDMTKERIYT